MSNLVEIPTHAALSITSGMLIPPPDEGNGMVDLQTAFETVTGEPVFTHMLAHEPFVNSVADHVRAHTEMGDLPEPKPESPQGWVELSKRLHERHGGTVSLPGMKPGKEELGRAFSEPLEHIGKGR